ncbi:MAG: ACT domain-containing protein [Candidatus Hodarchaeota archaeon]
MSGISNLKTLLKLMKPKIMDCEFIFCTISETHFSELNITPLLMFTEEEGITLIVKKKIAENYSIPYSGVWAWIILTVHSNLSAVGFLSVITDTFAKSGISVNIVSAYYHDHLFVPIEKANQAMRLLEELTTIQ